MGNLNLYHRNPELEALEKLKLTLDSEYKGVREYIEISESDLKLKLQINNFNTGLLDIVGGKDKITEFFHSLIIKFVNFIKLTQKYQNEFDKQYSKITQELFILKESNTYKENVLKTTLEGINSHVLTIQESSNSLSSELEKKDRKIQTLNDLYLQTKGEKESLNKEKEFLNSKIKVLQIELEELDGLKIRSQDYNLTHILEELNKYKTSYVEASQLRNQIIKLEENNRRLENSNTKLYSDMHGTFSEILQRLGNIVDKQDIEDSIKLLQAILLDSQEENKELKRELTNKDTELSEKDTRIRELERQLAEANEMKDFQQRSLDAIIGVVELAKTNGNKTIPVKEISDSIKPANNSLPVSPSDITNIYEGNLEHHKTVKHQASKLQDLVDNQDK